MLKYGQKITTAFGIGRASSIATAFRPWNKGCGCRGALAPDRMNAGLKPRSWIGTLSHELKFVAIALLFISGTQLFAGTQGILEGRVRDKDNRSDLIGVNVVIVGTSIGAATNIEG